MDYNPRQITQMRWRDAKNIEKFIKGQVVLYDIDFSSSDSRNFDTTPEAKELAKTIKYCYNNQIPLTIYESNNDWVFISYWFEDEMNAHLIRVQPNITEEILIQVYENRIEIIRTEEEILTSDNVKSVFNKSIIGSGNITLFRHIITITTSSQDFILLEYISSNNLKVDSVQDLKTLCGNNFTLPVEGIYQVGPDTFSKVVKLVGTNATLDYTTIKSDGTLKTLSALTGKFNDVVTTL